MSAAEPFEPAVPVAYCRTCGQPVMNATPQQITAGTVFCELHTPIAAAGPGGFGGSSAAASSYDPGFGPAAGFAGAAPGMGPQAVPPSPWTTGTPPPLVSPGASSASAGLAFLLGFIPGVGAVYNGQYAKGLIHAVVTGLLISIISSGSAHGLEPLFGLLIAAWFFYMPFEAFHTAKRRQAGLVVDEFSSILPSRGSRSVVGPVVLIGFGVLFLLNNLDILNFEAVVKYWPLAFIGLGAYLLYIRVAPGHIDPEVEREQR